MNKAQPVTCAARIQHGEHFVLVVDLLFMLYETYLYGSMLLQLHYVGKICKFI
ncbi:hypothetical protein EXN66_Car022153 [Channa argus]|uniref:Uncharacterized protein n=1 Tax=Channa argus TaxID=215402 RepID=A0A6G1QUT6_CHAAH|nr:hypothetical protein EXN66_Car022153 [Channa argus]